MHDAMWTERARMGWEQEIGSSSARWPERATPLLRGRASPPRAAPGHRRPVHPECANTQVPATSTSRARRRRDGSGGRSTPPSTSSSHRGARWFRSARARVSFGITSWMNFCPPKPGFTVS
jgi:hypothetical protein